MLLQRVREDCSEALFPNVFPGHNELKTANHQDKEQGWYKNPRFFWNFLIVLQSCKQVAPRGQWFVDPQSQHSQIRLSQDKGGDEDPELRRNDRSEIRQHMNPQQARSAASIGSRVDDRA